jgi:hypothetical protein
VVEWVERWLENTSPPWFAPGRLRRAQLKTLGETDREISYEDFGG